MMRLATLMIIALEGWLAFDKEVTVDDLKNCLADHEILSCSGALSISLVVIQLTSRAIRFYISWLPKA